MSQNLKEQIEKEISELKCGKYSIKQLIKMVDNIEKYITILWTLYSSKEILILEKIRKFSAEIASQCSNSSQLVQIVKHLFEKLLHAEKVYPACFEIEREKFELIHMREIDEILSFYWYVLFMEIISQLSEINLLKDLIQKAENSGNLNLRRVVLFCFKNTKKISWNKKRELFWKWEQNPVFVFWESKEVSWFVEGPLSLDIAYVCSNDILIYKHEECKKVVPIVDSYFLLKDIPELKKEVMEEDTIFRYCNAYINKINEKIYCSFLKNEEDKKNLVQLYYLLKQAENWNASIKGLFKIKNKENKKKNEELMTLTWLIYNVPEILQHVKKFDCSEPPDFIIKTHDGKKIALELTAIDLSKEVKNDRKGETPSVIKLAPHEIMHDICKRIERKIEEKIRKYNTKEYDEKWLFLHILSSKLIAETFIFERIKTNSYIKQIVEQCSKEIKAKYGNTFQRIYFMYLGEEDWEIKEIISGRKDNISQEWRQYVHCIIWKNYLEKSFEEVKHDC